MSNFEPPDPTCIVKGKAVAREHHDAAVKGKNAVLSSEPIRAGMVIQSIDDLPPYIRKHASYYQNGIKVVLPYGYLIEEADVDKLPKAKKWIKEHGGGYDDRGYWFIELPDSRIFLRELYDHQDTRIEHKEPKDSVTVSYFIEAAGDIYRELMLKNPDNSYIAEKLRRLNRFSEITIGDEREMLDAHYSNPNYSWKLWQYLLDVNELKIETGTFDFKDYVDRKPKMLKALSVIEAIAEWGRRTRTKTKTIIEINELIKIFEWFKGGN